MLTIFKEDAYEQAVLTLFEEMGYEKFCGYEVERDYREPLRYIVFKFLQATRPGKPTSAKILSEPLRYIAT